MARLFRSFTSSAMIIMCMLVIGGQRLCAEERVFKIALGDWCPYSCDPEKENGNIGYTAEILTRVFEKAGFNVETELMPFSRILKTVRKGEFTVCPAMFKKNAPDFVFPKNPIGVSTYHFYVTKDTRWRYKGFDSLTELKALGLIQNYSYEVLDPDIARFLNEYPAKNAYIAGVKPLERNFKKLLVNRVDTVLEDEWVTAYTLNKMKILGKVIDAGHIGKPVSCYVGFSPAISRSREYAQMLDKGVNELRKSGELQKILNKYGVSDWVP